MDTLYKSQNGDFLGFLEFKTVGEVLMGTYISVGECSFRCKYPMSPEAINAVRDLYMAQRPRPNSPEEELGPTWLTQLFDVFMIAFTIEGDEISFVPNSEKWHDEILKFFEALAPFAKPGGILEIGFENNDKARWKVIEGKLVQLKLVEIWLDPGKEPVCPECGTALGL